VEVASSPAKGSARRAGEFQAEMPIEPALAEWSVLLGVADTKMAASLSKIIRAEGIRAKFFSNMDEARTLIAKTAHRWRYLSTTRLVSTVWKCAARSASKRMIASIGCPWSWSPHRKIRHAALRRASRTG